MSPLKVSCGNYCPVVERSGALIAADNGNGSGDMRVSRNSGGVTSSFSKIATLSQSKLRSWGVKNSKGLTVSWARTIGLAQHSGVIHALIHMGTGYPTKGGYIPVYSRSSDGGKSWSTGKAVKVGGSVKYIFSSSMAYQIVNGVHYMVQDAGAYGYGNLVMFRSSDGVNWSKHSGNIASLTGDSSPAWPSLAYYGGRFHLVYTPKWDNSTIRHVSSADGKSWRVEKSKAGFAFKGCNIFVSKANLYCHSRPSGRLWSISGVGGSSTGGSTDSGSTDSGSSGDKGGLTSGVACGSATATTGSNSVTGNWNNGTCEFKLYRNGSSIHYMKLAGSTYTKSGLPAGSGYELRLRNPSSGAATIIKSLTVGGTSSSGTSSGDSGGSSTSSGEACGDLSVTASSNSVSAKYNHGTCEFKLRRNGSVIHYKKLTGSTYSKSVTSTGSYDIGLRNPATGKAVWRTVNVGSSSTPIEYVSSKDSQTSSSSQACKNLSVAVSGNTVTARYDSGTCEIKAKNSSGKTVYYKKLSSGSHSFSLPSGVYTIIVRNPADGSNVAKKVSVG